MLHDSLDCRTSLEDAPRLLALGGTLRQGSYTQSLLYEAAFRAEAVGADVVCADLRTLDLPLLNRDLPLEAYPASLPRLLSQVRDADGIVLCSGTHFGSVPGVVKNVLDLLIYGDEQPFAGKPVGLIAYGGANGMHALAALSTVAQSLGGLVVPAKVLVPHGAVSTDGRLTDEAVATRLDRLMRDLVGLARVLGPARRDVAVLS